MVPGHPCHGVLSSETPPRFMKMTLQKKFGGKIRHFARSDNTSDKADFKINLKSLHTDTVVRAKAEYEANKVLKYSGKIPPPTMDKSKTLPRRTRT